MGGNLMINDLKKVLKKERERFQELINDGYGSDTIGDYTINIEEQFGGEEQGSSYWVVFSASKDYETRYFKLDGWYASYVGFEFDDYLSFYEVEQVEKVIKVWEPK